MSDIKKSGLSRRGLLKAGAVGGLVAATPSFFIKNAWAEEFRNNPENSGELKLGSNEIRRCAGLRKADD